MTPKQLKPVSDVSITGVYDPEDVVKEFSGLPLQDFEIMPAVPLYLMSPRIRVYRAQDIIRFKGYLSKFEVVEARQQDGPEVVITIEPVEEKG